MLCHEGSRLDIEGLTRWLGATMTLSGVIVLTGRRSQLWRAVRREIRRSGWRGLAGAVALRVLYAGVQGRRDHRWLKAEIARLASRYQDVPGDVRWLRVASPNSDAVRRFLREIGPDLMVARCKVLLKRDVYEIPRQGTFVLHPGICPEYRNAHGCFWALARRDLSRVGLTVLRIDDGVDTGPVYLHATYSFDERRESYVRIQTRVLLENLDLIARTLCRVVRGDVTAIDVSGRRSAAWGHPTLGAWWRWRRAARRHETTGATVRADGR